VAHRGGKNTTSGWWGSSHGHDQTRWNTTSTGSSWSADGWHHGSAWQAGAQEGPTGVDATELPAVLARLAEDERSSLLKFFTSNHENYGSAAYTQGVAKLRQDWGISHDDVSAIENYLQMAHGIQVPAELSGVGAVKVGNPTELIKANAVVEAGISAQNKPQKSMTHGARYMRSLLGGRNPAISTIGQASLAKFSGTEKDRIELFTSWVKSEEDWGVCEIIEERFREAIHQSKKTHKWCTWYDMMKLYGNDTDMVKKVQDVTRQTNASHFRKNTLLAGEEKLDTYYIRVGDEVVDKESRGSREALSLRAAGDKEYVKKLVGDVGGFTRPTLAAELPPPPTPKHDPSPKGKKRPLNAGDGEPKKEAKTGADLMVPEDMKDPIAEATDYANQLSAQLGKGHAVITRLKALGMGSDISDKIKAACDSLEQRYLSIKQLTKSDVVDKWKYKKDMDWAKHYYKLLKTLIKIGNALINASEPKRKSAAGGGAAAGGNS